MMAAIEVALQSGSNCLDLSGCDLTESNGSQDLVLLLQENRCPKKLDLSTAKISSEGFLQLLAALLVNRSVVDLNLSTNHLCGDYISSDGSLRALLQTNKTLQKINLTGHSLRDELVVDLTQGLQQNSTLLELVLYNCSLTEESASLVVKNAANLRLLDLGANKNFSPDFLNSSIATCLNNSTRMESLALDNSPSMFAVDATDLSPFFRALEINENLKTLSLRCCKLTEKVGEVMLQTLTINSSLTFLDLEFSGFGLRDRGNEILIDLLPRFRALQELKFLVRFPAKMVPQLVEAVQENLTLQAFRPMLGSDRKAEQEVIQAALQRNLRMAEAQTLVQVGANVTGALLPKAISHMNQSPPGSTATFQVMQYWIAEVCGDHNYA